MGYKKIKINVFLLGLLLILSYSCNKEEEKAVVLLSPFEIILSNIKPLDVVSIEVDCHSPSELNHFRVTSKIKDSFSKTELDTAISGKSYHVKFEFKVPSLIESTRIILEFSLTDATGEVVSNAKILDVVVVPKYLTETAGHEIYTKASGKQNAYNLLNGTPQFSRLADSLIMHISDTSNNSVLLKRWVSPARLKFVRFNGFDYANCTNISVKNSYDAGIKFDFIDNLIQGDILLTRISDKSTSESYIVMKIVNVIDSPGSEWDRIVFNLKK